MDGVGHAEWYRRRASTRVGVVAAALVAALVASALPAGATPDEMRRVGAAPEPGVVAAETGAGVPSASPVASERSPEGESGLSLFAVSRTAAGLEMTTYEPETALEAAAIAATLRDDDGFVSLEVDAPVHSLAEPRRPEQWALDRVVFEQVWPLTTGSGATVAVLDTGVYAGHEDLAGVVLAGKDFVGGGDGRTDPGGHGTLVAGIVAAALNGRGMAGAAPGARILPVRVLAADGSGYMSNVSKGIVWAADHGADVITMSLGGTAPSSGVQEAMRYARGKGVPVFAAAGNNAMSGNPVIYPAAYPEAVAVGAVDGSLSHSVYSSHHDYVDFAAPGDSILSAGIGYPSSYVLASGTSMAAPYAAAAAALVAASSPGLDADGIEQALVNGALDLGAPGRDPYYGHGLVDVVAAVAAVARNPGQISQPPGSGGYSGDPDGGYWVVSADGRVRAFGDARHYGDATITSAPIVAATPTTSGRGYWVAAADGRVFSFGDARHHGDAVSLPLNAPIVSMAVTPSGGGYFLLGADGGIFAFGDADFRGSTGGIALNAPVLDMTVTATGNGYWLVAADGGIFTFGDAVFRGSTGGLALNQPVRSMTASADGDGYWLVARDGGIFSFGVPFLGSLPTIGADHLDGTRIRALRDGRGYYILTADGGVHAFGTAAHLGAAVPLTVSVPAVDLMLVP